MTDYKSMFEQAVRTLAAIDEALGIGDDGCGDPEQTLEAIACLKASPISEEAMDILRAKNEKLKTEVEEFAVLTSRLARQLKKAAPDNELPGKVADYLKRTGRQGSPLREVGAGRTAPKGHNAELRGRPLADGPVDRRVQRQTDGREHD